MRSHALWLAGATAVTIAATATAAAAGPVGAPRLAAVPVPAAPGVAAAPGASLVAAVPDFGRRRGNPGATRTPTAKVSLTEADSGTTITVKPGTEIDVTLRPDSGTRWSPPRSDNPNAVSRGGRMGWHRGPGGRQQDTPGLGPGRGRRGNGTTNAVFFAHADGDATLSSAEHRGGLMLLQRGSGPTRSWSVKVTVLGPAPAASKPQPKPQPKPGTPGAGVPGAPGLPGVSQAPAAAARLVAPVTAAVRKLALTPPRL